MGYNYAWLLSATYVDLRLTNAVFQVSVVPGRGGPGALETGGDRRRRK